jgi:hypothetical protein
VIPERRILLVAGLAGSSIIGSASMVAQQPALQRPPEAHRTFSDPSAYVPDPALLTAATSELRDTVDRFAIDGQAIQRFYNIPGSDERRERLRRYYTAWLAELPKMDFARLSREGQVDYVLLRTHIEYQVALLNREERVGKATAPLVPFANDIVALQEQRQKLEFISGRARADRREAPSGDGRKPRRDGDAARCDARVAVRRRPARHARAVVRFL